MAIQARFRSLEAAGHGKLVAEADRGMVRLSFGPLMVVAENYNTALKRLEGAGLHSITFRHLLTERAK